VSSVVSFRWDIPPSVLAGRVGDYGKRLLAAVHALGDFFAAKIEAWAKANAPWTDRTGNARQGLAGLTIKAATGVVIILTHGAGVSYGIWLEVAHGGVWGIILRTLESFYPQIMSALQALVRG
jgi:hypothetical protein